MGDGWSKGILEFPFGPNLGLRLEAGTWLNNCNQGKIVPKVKVAKGNEDADAVDLITKTINQT